MSKSGVAILLGCAFILQSGCVSFASRSEYAAYRGYRQASGEEQVGAMADYLEAYPEGQWADEVRSAYASREQAYYVRHRETIAGLRQYLDAYPEGAFSEVASERIEALQRVAARRAEVAEETRVRLEAERVAAQEARRGWAAAALSYWTRILLGVRQWGVPMAQVVAENPAFDEAFGADPRPVCTQRHCIKSYALEYALSARGQTRQERRIQIVLRLRLTEGRLMGAELLLPGRGFSRWYELEQQQSIADFDPEQRQGSIDWALSRLIPIVREIAPTAASIDVAAPPVEPLTASDPSANTDSLLLPLTLHGLREGPMQIVVFSAADEDEGEAMDGFYIAFEPSDDEGVAEETSGETGQAEPEE